MSKAKLLVLGAVLCALASCHVVTPPETATVKGRIILLNDWGMPNPPYGGILVKFEGTGMSALTDDSGYYSFPAVPEDEYNVRFSKTGYGDMYWRAVTITGGHEAVINWGDGQSYNHLNKRSNISASIASADMFDTLPEGYNVGANVTGVMVHGTFSSLAPYHGFQDAIAIYLSHHSDVSSAPGHYETFVYTNYITGFAYRNYTNAFDTATGQFNLPLQLYNLKSLNFNSGDSLYMAAYGAPYYSYTPVYDYYDPVIHQNVLTAIDTSASAVVGMRLP